MKIKKNISKLADEALLGRYRDSGTIAYFGELYSRYIPLLYGVSLKYLNDSEQAYNAVKDLFETIAPQISQKNVKVFRTWIYSAMRNHCLLILREKTPDINMEFGSKNEGKDEIQRLLEMEDEADDRVVVLKQCIKKLPVEQRIAILRFFKEEMSYQDIADTAGYTLNQVKTYIQNGKRNLKICIEKKQ